MRKKKTKKSVGQKVPLDGKLISIYGIFNLKTRKLVKVDLNENDIWFEYDMCLYTPEEYAVICLKVSISG